MRDMKNAQNHKYIHGPDPAPEAIQGGKMDKLQNFSEASVLQSFIFLFFMLVFHAAISVSALISMAEAVINA